jgi:ATP-binding cassette subfamily C protein
MSRFLLNGAAGAWRIDWGVVDVFSVPLADGRPSGAQAHLFRLEAGRTFAGVGAPRDGVGLLAVASPGARLETIDAASPDLTDWLSELADAASGAANASLDDVLERISAGRGAQDARAAQRLSDWTRSDARIFGGAVEQLARVMANENSQASPFVQKTGDPLIDALRQVLSASGIEAGAELVARGDDAALADEAGRIEAMVRPAGAGLRVVSLEGDRWWRLDAGPLLAFRREGAAPVALIPARGGGYWLIDPAAGLRARLDAKAAGDLEPQAYMVFRAFPDRAIGLLALLRFGLRGAGADVRRTVALGLLGGLMGLAVPMATGLLINSVIPTAHKSGLVQLVLLLVTTTVGVSAFEFTRALALMRIDARASAGVQAAMMLRLLRLPAAFFRDHATGDLTQRLFGVTQVLQLASNAAQTAVAAWIFSLASFGFLFLLDWRLGLVASALVAVALAVTVVLNALRLRLERRMFQAQGDIASSVFQVLTGISKLRANGAEKRAFSLWAGRFAQQKTLDFGIRRIANALEVFNAGFVVLASLALFAAVAAIAPNMDTGAFAAFNAAFGQFFAATLAMTAALTASLNAVPLYERSRPVLNALPEPDRSQTVAAALTGSIDISHVTFRYAEGGPAILDDVTLNIAPGDFVAIVGRSGSGKSTLFRLLLGFEQPQSGAIYYDGQDLAGLDLRTVRRQLGVVLQNGKLMPGELYTNIIGASRLTLDDAWEAARQAGMEDDIKAMPMGMHTVIAEGASVISGGQKQRLMIARALAAKPRILLFDEATSALDAHTQAAVARSVSALKATRVVIAHRLSTIIDADRIFVMDAGRLVESGTYAELMARGGLFADLAKRQLV